MIRFLVVLSCTLLGKFSWSSPAIDTTIQRVKVVFNFQPSVFPSSWLVVPISAKIESIDPAEMARSKTIAVEALRKYPIAILDLNLKHIYFAKSIKFYDVLYGATNSGDALFITNNGSAQGYSNKFIEQTIHHEFSSVLFRNYAWLLDTSAWKKINAPGSVYTDPEAGVGAIRKDESSQVLDTALASKGFLTQYALSDVENDINTFAQNFFVPDAAFWDMVDKYPRIRQKASMLIRFYHSILVTFTEPYFRDFGKNP